jgi:hypothetical protein
VGATLWIVAVVEAETVPCPTINSKVIVSKSDGVPLPGDGPSSTGATSIENEPVSPVVKLTGVVSGGVVPRKSVPE